jgi:hypothetical protein
MKRLFLVILLVMFVAWFTSVRHARVRGRGELARLDERARGVAHEHREALRASAKARRDASQAVDEARREAHRAVAEAKVEVRQALDEAAHEVRKALEEAAQEIRQAVDGIPVPIVPGTRVTEAVAQPPAPPEAPDLAEAPPQPAASPEFEHPGFPGLVKHPGVMPAASAGHNHPVANKEPETRLVKGLPSADEERAKADARKQLDQVIADWLDAQGLPRSWKPSPRQIEAMILETKVSPVVKPYGTVYEAELRVDVSPEVRAGLAETYQRQLVHQRIVFLGGTLGFVLVCLGAVSGYIRADEATKGYYTNRLRMLAAAGVGAAGVVIYQMVA